MIMAKVVPLDKPKRYQESKTDSGKIGLSQNTPVFKKYIKGPISLAWITKASQVSSRALAVGVLVWYWYGLTGSLTVKVTTKRLKEFGISRSTCFRALKDLEDAHLVLVDRSYGRAPLVTILVNV